jgi:4-diphosphocytidyl-2C-methyl-D-erythritol kinase
LWLVILTPPYRVSEKTKLAYARLNASHYSSGERARQIAASLSIGQMPHEDDLFNSFESIADSLFPGIGNWRKRVEGALGKPTHLAGAGPSIFALFAKKAEADEAARRVASADAAVFVAHFLDRPASLRAAP